MREIHLLCPIWKGEQKQINHKLNAQLYDNRLTRFRVFHVRDCPLTIYFASK